MDSNEYSIRMRKEPLLRDCPVFQNQVLVDTRASANETLSTLHFHEFIEISLVLSGKGQHYVWNDRTECVKGDLCILNIGSPHAYFAKSETEIPTVCNILFDPADLFAGDIADPESPNFCYGIFTDNAACVDLSLKPRQMDELEKLSQLIREEILKKDAQWLDAVRAHLTLYLVRVKRFLLENTHALPDVRSKDRAIISGVVRYVMEHYSDSDLTLEGIAQSLYMTKSSLSRKFRSVTGEYFSDYVRSVRLKEACHLLAETPMTNEQIVYSCGLRDIPTFYRQFKAQYMQTPNQYRSANNKLQKCNRCEEGECP